MEKTAGSQTFEKNISLLKKDLLKRTVGSVKATDDVTLISIKAKLLARRRIRMWKNNGGQINFAAA